MGLFWDRSADSEQGDPGPSSPLLACSWFSLLGVHLRAPSALPAAGGLGAPAGQQLPWQPRPKPRLVPAKGMPSISWTLAEPATQAACAGCRADRAH